jgi:hypothetical protein
MRFRTLRGVFKTLTVNSCPSRSSTRSATIVRVAFWIGGRAV